MNSNDNSKPQARMTRKYILSLTAFLILTVVFGALVVKYNSESTLDVEDKKQSTEVPVQFTHVKADIAASPVSKVEDIKVPEPAKAALQEASSKDHPVLLRKFPYPYSAMLAISSDADYTTLEEFEEYHRFLNTKEVTPHGNGLGLDIGDSSWLYIANDTLEKVDQQGHTVEDSLSYFRGLNPKEHKDSDKIVQYFKAGWIDSLHSFGDFSRNDQSAKFTRSLAVDAWEAMKESGFKPKVWINHGSESNVQNFGGYNPKTLFKYHAGDDPNSPFYHTDLTLRNGIRYVWNSIGSDQFSTNDPLFPINLRDGHKVWGFKRYTHDISKGKLVWTWESDLISQQITKPRLEQLISEEKYSIVTQHLGKRSQGFPFTPEGIQSLQMLKAYNEEGKILVARTSRLLDYSRCYKFIRYGVTDFEGKTYINIEKFEDPVLGPSIPTLDEIRGITFYVDHPENTFLLLNLDPIPEDTIQRNEPDGNGRKSIGVKWYEPDYTDYTVREVDGVKT